MKRSPPRGWAIVPGSHWPFLLICTWVPGARSLGPNDAAPEASSGGGVVEGVHAAPKVTVSTRAALEAARARRRCRIMAPDDSGARGGLVTKSRLVLPAPENSHRHHEGVTARGRLVIPPFGLEPLEARWKPYRRSRTRSPTTTRT